MSPFARGFRAMLPVWLGVVPFAVAYAVTARASGLSVLETCLMSVFVFAGASQFSAAGLFAAGASGPAIVFTAFLLNVRHLLYGVSLGRAVELSVAQRFAAAYLLTDEAYGVTMASRERSAGFLFGAEVSLFLSWNAFTLVGALAGAAIPDPASLGVDFVFPLSFVALLVPLVRSRAEAVVAVASGLLALGLSRALPGGLPVLVTGALGALLGAWLTRREPPPGAASFEDAAREAA